MIIAGSKHARFVLGGSYLDDLSTSLHSGGD